MKVLRRAPRVGLIEIGSNSIRYMIATFDRAGHFQIDARGKDSFVHNVKVDNLEGPTVAKLWQRVEGFNHELMKIHCDEIFVYGTELCRRLKARSFEIPSFVTVLSAYDEARAAWMAGYLSCRSKGHGHRCTIIDQGGGSVELATGVWTGRTVAEFAHANFDDLGHSKLADLYAAKGETFSRSMTELLDTRSALVGEQERKDATQELVILGSAATKLGFNIKHKRNEEDDYRPHDTDKTIMSVKEILQYYSNLAKIYAVDPARARYLIDRRTTLTNEYEIVMSGAILIMLLAIRLGYERVTVSVNSTRYGVGFMVASGIPLISPEGKAPN